MHLLNYQLKRWAVILWPLFLLPNSALSQDEIRRHFWIDYYSDHNLGSKWNYEWNVGLKYLVNGERYSKSKLRNTLSYELNDKISLIKGLDFHSRIGAKHAGNWEIRAWQAVKLKCILFQLVPLSNLLAFEERILHASGESGTALMGRFRYELGVNVPLGIGPLYVPFKEEIYLNTGEGARHFDHISRINIGLGCHINQSIRAEASLVNQHSLRNGERSIHFTDKLCRLKLRYRWN